MTLGRRWKSRLLVLASIVVIAAKLTSRAAAGEVHCEGRPEEWVAALERWDRSAPAWRLRDALGCMRCMGGSSVRWAGPIAAARFEECRNSPWRDRIAAACAPLLEDSTHLSPFYEETVAVMAAGLLASLGVGEVAGHDTFQILTEQSVGARRLGVHNLVALAVLADPRTVGFLAAGYDSLPATDASQHEWQVKGLLNCLWHLPGQDAIELTIRIRDTEADPRLKERADRVIQR